jgi:hypothetical protein
MSQTYGVFQAPPGTDLARYLDQAGDEGVIQTERGRYRVSRLDEVGRSKRPRRVPDPALRQLMGLIDEGEPTDIARHKDEYLAEAAEHRAR